MYCIRNIKFATIFVYEGISIVKRMSKLHEVHVMNIQRAHKIKKSKNFRRITVRVTYTCILRQDCNNIATLHS